MVVNEHPDFRPPLILPKRGCSGLCYGLAMMVWLFFFFFFFEPSTAKIHPKCIINCSDHISGGFEDMREGGAPTVKWEGGGGL